MERFYAVYGNLMKGLIGCIFALSIAQMRMACRSQEACELGAVAPEGRDCSILWGALQGVPRVSGAPQLRSLPNIILKTQTWFEEEKIMPQSNSVGRFQYLFFLLRTRQFQPD